MDVRAGIIAVCWLAVSMISIVSIWLQFSFYSSWSGYFEMMLIFGAFIVTFALAFGLKPETKTDNARRLGGGNFDRGKHALVWTYNTIEVINQAENT